MLKKGIKKQPSAMLHLRRPSLNAWPLTIVKQLQRKAMFAMESLELHMVARHSKNGRIGDLGILNPMNLHVKVRLSHISMLKVLQHK